MSDELYNAWVNTNDTVYADYLVLYEASEDKAAITRAYRRWANGEDGCGCAVLSEKCLQVHFNKIGTSPTY